MTSVSIKSQLRYIQPPSKVLHLRNLPWECTEEELIEFRKPFGKVVNTIYNVGEKTVLAGHPDYELTGESIIFKGENVLEMDPEGRSLTEILMSFQSPIEIPGVNNIDFLNMAYNAQRRKLGQPKLGPIE
ncbi:hypothetical protein U1Q18_034864, partial [Sarracenia purpurea var. burkii]